MSADSVINFPGAVYAAVIVAIVSGLLATLVGSWVIWKICRTKTAPRPVAGILLLVVLAVAIAQVLEQTKVLTFRLAYDGHIDRQFFATLYNSTWSAVSSKLLMAMAISASSMLQLALYCRRSQRAVLFFVLAGWLGTFVGWLGLTILLEFIT